MTWRTSGAIVYTDLEDVHVALHDKLEEGP